jgi:hypothetical protein
MVAIVNILEYLRTVDVCVPAVYGAFKSIMPNLAHDSQRFLTSLVDSAFSGDHPTSISRSLYLAVRRSSLLLAKA